MGLRCAKLIFQLWVFRWELICPVVVQNFGLFRLFPALVLPRFIIGAECHFQLTTIHSVLFQKSVRRLKINPTSLLLQRQCDVYVSVEPCHDV